MKQFFSLRRCKIKKKKEKEIQKSEEICIVAKITMKLTVSSPRAKEKMGKKEKRLRELAIPGNLETM